MISLSQKARDWDLLICGDTNKLWSVLKDTLLSQLQHKVQSFSQGECMWLHGMGHIEGYKASEVQAQVSQEWGLEKTWENFHPFILLRQNCYSQYLFCWSYFKKKGVAPQGAFGGFFTAVLSKLLKQMRTVKAMTGKPIRLLMGGNMKLNSPGMILSETKSHCLPISVLGLKLVIFKNFFCAWGPIVPCLLFLPVAAWHWVLQGLCCRRIGRIDWFLSIIKTNVSMNTVPLSTANPSEQMQWWPWKGSAVSEERKFLFFSAWKSSLRSMPKSVPGSVGCLFGQ